MNQATPRPNVGQMRSGAVIERLKHQLDEQQIAQYVGTARQFGHEIQIVLFVMPNGQLGTPRFSIHPPREKKNRS